MTEDAEVVALANLAGLEVIWTDIRGERRAVGLDTIKAVLKALDLPAESSAGISESASRLLQDRQSIPPLQITNPGGEVRILATRSAELVKPDGTRIVLKPDPEQGNECTIQVPHEIGYYQIESEKGQFGFAVVPPHALRPRDLEEHRKLAGIAVQIYSLRGGTSGNFGDFAALGTFAKDVGRSGIDAIMVSPTHALFGAEPGTFIPYSPSTRLFLNPLFADVTLEGMQAESDTGDENLIDWASAGPAKFRQLELAYARFRQQSDRTEFKQFCRDGGERLRAHALFEALDSRFRKSGITGFTNWPAEFQGPDSAGAWLYERDATEEYEFQLFLQWLSARSAIASQKSARETMSIGIIADIAVGMDPLGSHAWSAPDELLCGLQVGAPPDYFNTRGQDWGLTTISPRALRRCGYSSFIATLRANMAYAGGVRIDHALGLRRLWVIPSGGSPADGVYLHYPQHELLGIIALESQLNRTIVIGEDLGTVPAGFRDELSDLGALGMQVLWFERDQDGNFISPERWRRDAVAMTTTHDLPTVAGWWSGTDIAWHERLDQLRMSEDQEQAERAANRERLWSDLRNAKCATGAAPTLGEPDAVVTAALKFIGKSRCDLAVAPIEDVSGEREQPNLPGTICDHPNWRRRMKQGDLLHDETVRARLDAFTSARETT